MNGSDFVKFSLRTPLRIFMGNTMLLTVTGCKTGRKYSTPVNYYRGDGCLWVLTSRNRTWWWNVRNGAEVTLLMNGQTLNAFARAELDEAVIGSRLVEYLQQFPMAARSLGIRVKDRVPNDEDVKCVARDKLFVRITLSTT